MNLFDTSGAMFSPCQKYRYRLWRTWCGGEGLCNFLMLNPSTANDPTVERCERRAMQWGYAGLVVTNLFAFRSTSPLDMKAEADPVGPENDDAIITAATEAALVVCAWGEHGSHMDRAAKVLTLLDGIDLHCLKVNSGGAPAHPLYLSYDLNPVRFGC